MFDSFREKESSHPNSILELGSVYQRDRIEAVAEFCCQEMSGDLIEIGCYAGGTSTRLAKVARKYNRKLICIDNWRDGTDYDLPGIKKIFQKDMKEFSDVTIIVEGDAHDEAVIRLIKEFTYCFAFSDDGHSYQEHLCELTCLLPITNGLVFVDDIYLPKVRKAIADSITINPGWVELYCPEFRESWLFKS